MKPACRWRECLQSPDPPCSGEMGPWLVRLRGEDHVLWFCGKHGTMWLELWGLDFLEDGESVVRLAEGEEAAASVMLR